jgi:hypothetical protein
VCWMATGRELMVAWLRDEITKARTADLQRAAEFLEFARQVRGGCAKQRAKARKDAAQGWRRYLDTSVTW